mmetsp:Transcript_35047/g.93855  ORF Transcript_35047/g.93855 Transcript_35047/m.93855 type:complete len:419 (-) Transcript_35047:39-1295(-)
MRRALTVAAPPQPSPSRPARSWKSQSFMARERSPRPPFTSVGQPSSISSSSGNCRNASSETGTSGQAGNWSASSWASRARREASSTSRLGHAICRTWMVRVSISSVTSTCGAPHAGRVSDLHSSARHPSERAAQLWGISSASKLSVRFRHSAITSSTAPGASAPAPPPRLARRPSRPRSMSMVHRCSRPGGSEARLPRVAAGCGGPPQASAGLRSSASSGCGRMACWSSARSLRARLVVFRLRSVALRASWLERRRPPARCEEAAGDRQGDAPPAPKAPAQSSDQSVARSCSIMALMPWFSAVTRSLTQSSMCAKAPFSCNRIAFSCVLAQPSRAIRRSESLSCSARSAEHSRSRRSRSTPQAASPPASSPQTSARSPPARLAVDVRSQSASSAIEDRPPRSCLVGAPSASSGGGSRP